MLILVLFLSAAAFHVVVSGCPSGYWGPDCTSKCPHQHCYDTYACNQNTGNCPSQYDCDTGWWGPNCESKCTHQHCYDTYACNGHTGNCPNEYSCDTGYWGQNCELTCLHKHCYDTNACNGHTGNCPKLCSCDSSWWGPNCETGCSHKHCYDTYACQGGSGICPHQYDCDTGWWGPNCDSACTHQHCYDTNACDGHTGNCPKQYSCDSGYWGPNCENKCLSTHCYDTYACDGKTGLCMHGCDSGWCGSDCNTKCRLGSYPTNVTKSVTLMEVSVAKRMVDKRVLDKRVVDKRVVDKRNKRRFIDSQPCGSSLPDSCINPQGATNCDFYTSCLEKAHPCGNSGYALNFGEKFCKKFLDLNSDPTMSKLGKQWMVDVRQCLQNAAVSLAYDLSLTCSEIQTKAFASHPLCYTQQGGVLCQNPSLWVSLVKVIGWDTLKFGVLSNAASVLGYCVSDSKTYLALAAKVGKAFLTVAKETVSFAVAAAKWIEHAAVNLVEGMYHWWEALSFLSVPTKGSDDASPFKTSVLQMMSFLGQFYGNMSTACNMSRSDNKCPDTFEANMTLAAQVYAQPSKWLIVEKTKDIRLYDRPDVRFDKVFQNLSLVCSTGKYDSCAGNATLVAWISVGENTSDTSSTIHATI